MRLSRSLGTVLLLVTVFTISFSSFAIQTGLGTPTWSAETPITTPAGDDRQPALVKTKAGVQFLAWSTSKDGTPDIYYMTKSGASWSPPSKVEQGGLGATHWDQYPALVELANGKVLVLWAQCPPPTSPSCTIVYNTYSFSSPHWDSEGFTVLVSEGSLNNAPSAARAADGYVYVLWQSDRTVDYDVYYTRSPNPDAIFPSWDPETQMPRSTVGVDDLFPSTVPANGGGLWVAWHSNQDLRPCCPTRDAEIYLSKYTGTWSSPPVQLTTTDDRNDPVSDSHDTDPSLAITTDGGLWLVWESDRDSTNQNAEKNLYTKRSYDPLNLSSWTADLRLTTDTAVDAWPTTFQEAAGTITTVWASNRATVLSPYDLFTATLTFHNLQVLSVTPNPTAVQPGGTIVVNATVANRGAFSESLVLNLYANTTLLTSTPLTSSSSPGEIKSFLYSWSTTGFSVGTYRLRAELTAVPGEETLTDNILEGSTAVVASRDVSIGPITVTNCPNLSSCYLYRGQTINVKVNVANQGQVVETFTVTLRYNGTYIGQGTVASIQPGQSLLVTIAWNTTSISPGPYQLEASTPGLQAEKDQLDNSSILLVKIKKAGDVDGDGDVDIDDLISTYLAQFSINPQYDIDGDGDVDIDDLILVFINQFT